MKIKYLLFLTALLVGCQEKSLTDVPHDFQEIEYEGIKFPEPKFNGDPERLLERIRIKYDAERAMIVRPTIFSSKEDYEYWLKVEFLNPEIGEKPFKEFSKEVALDIVKDITNIDDFKKIEISAVMKKGFIVTFTTKQNTFLYVDSLRN